MKVGLRLIEWFGIGLALLVATYITALGVFPLEHTRVIQRDAPPIQQGMSFQEVEKRLHFGRVTQSGYVPGGVMTEWKGPGWHIVFAENQALNHKPPGHPLDG